MYIYIYIYIYIYVCKYTREDGGHVGAVRRQRVPAEVVPGNQRCADTVWLALYSVAYYITLYCNNTILHVITYIYIYITIYIYIYTYIHYIYIYRERERDVFHRLPSWP